MYTADPLHHRYADSRGLGRGGRWLSWGLIAGAHVLALAAVFWSRSDERPARTALPMMVSFIVEQTPPPPEVRPPPPPKRPPPERPKPQEVMVATTEPTPSPMTAPPLEEPPVEIVEAPPAPPAPPAPVIPPNFVAAYLNNPPPQYPAVSKQRRETGTVLLRALVDPGGRAERVLIERSSGFSRLDEAAVEVVQKRWRFVPAKQGDRAVAAWVLIPMVFELKK